MIWLEILGVLVFSVSGALTAVRLGLDVVGALVLATATGLGGGVLRDVLIGDVPPPALVDWRYLVTPVVAGLLTFRLHSAIARVHRPVLLLDAIGLGLFSVAGALKSLEAGLGPLPAAVLGMITGVGGSVLRDTLCGEVPAIFRPGHLLAIPAFAGALIAATLRTLDLPTPAVVVGAATVTTLWRLLGVWRGWTTHAPGLRLSVAHRALKE